MVELSDKGVTTIQRPRLRLPWFGVRRAPGPSPVSPASPATLPKLSAVSTIVFVIGLALTALGLAIIRSEQQFTWIPQLLHDLLKPRIPNYQALVVGGTVALTGALLAGLAGRRVLPDTLAGLALPTPRFRRDAFALVAVLLAALCMGILYWRLAFHRYTHWDILLFFVGLVLVGFAINRLDKPAHAPTLEPAPRSDDNTNQPFDVPTKSGQVLSAENGQALPIFNLKVDLLLSVGLALFAIALNFIDLTRWDFSFVGDEGEFFQTAQEIVKGGDWNFFNLTWVYGAHPTLDSVYQGMVMKAVGDNVIGWRFSEILVTALTTVLVYLLISSVLGPGRLAAIGGGVFIASSNYLMAFNRIGYNNTHVIFYSTLTVLLLVLAWKKQRAILLYGSGVALGFCLYTFLSAVFMWGIVGLVLVSNFIRKPSRREVAGWAVMLVGMLLVVTPALIATPPDAFLHMAAQNTYADTANQPILPAVSLGFVFSFLSFWMTYWPWRSHHLGGPLFDALSGVLVLAGLFICIVRINKRLERLALIWFLLGMALVAVTDFGAAEPHVTRLFVVLPGAALLVGIAINKIEGVLRGGLRLPAVVASGLVLVTLAIIPPLNLYQLLVLGPSLTSVEVTYQAMVMKAVQEHPGYTIVEVGVHPGPDQQILMILGWYPWYEGRYRYSPISELGEPIPEGAQGNLPIYLVDAANWDIVQSVRDKLPTEYKLGDNFDPAHMHRVWLFMPGQRASTGQPLPGSPSLLNPELVAEVHVPPLPDGSPSAPRDVATDSQGNFYVVTDRDGIIRKYNPSGKLLLSWGNSSASLGAGSGGSAPMFRELFGIAIDSNDVIYALDSDANSIVRFDTQGKQIGTPITDVGYHPRGISIAPNNIASLASTGQTLLVADTGFDAISLFASDGTSRANVQLGNGPAELHEPADAVMTEKGDLFVVDTGNTRIAHFFTTGSFINQWDIDKPESPRDSGHIALDSHGRLFMTAPNKKQVIIYDAQDATQDNAGKVLGRWTAHMTEKPVGIFVDKQDNVYVTYPDSDIVRKFRLRR